MPEIRIVERSLPDPAAEREALVAGLRAVPATIAPSYFYDALGCALFGAICELPEYYPTRTEHAIFNEHREAIAHAAGRGKQFVDLGAGDCRKAAGWLPYLASTRYIALDIARDALAPALARMAADFPHIEMRGVVTDFTRGIDLAGELEPGPVMFFYPGSSIGNFAPAEALEFLRDIQGHCAGRDGSGLLIGVDTKKDPARLAAAYADAIGVTAAFNRNVLQHVNRVLGSDFQPEAYAHVGLYDATAGRVEMHLEATTRQTVQLPGTTRSFAPGERIHTENSYKYAPDEFRTMLHDAGFGHVDCWQDSLRDFAVFNAR